jgi:hypothetical protein
VANGFSEKPGYAIPPDCHHLPVLHEYQTGAGVDIHGQLSMGTGAQLLPTSWFYEGTRPFRLKDDLRVRLPDPTCARTCASAISTTWIQSRTQVPSAVTRGRKHAGDQIKCGSGSYASPMSPFGIGPGGVQPADSLVMPATKNLHNMRHSKQ